MNADDSTTDDDATDDEEEKETAADQDAECCFGDEANKDNLTIELEDVCNDHSAKDDGSMLQSQRSFDFEDVAPPKVWCKGDMCLAPYSGDTEYYQAVINTIRKTCNGEKQAVVTFTGYESEESELVPLRALRRVPQQRKRTKKDVVESEALLTNSSFFTHLKGNEMEESMRSKYGEYEVESQRVQAKLDSKEHSDIHKKTLARLSSSKVKEKKKGKLNVSVQRKKKLLDSRSRKRKGRTCPVVQEVKDKTDETTAEERPLQPHDLISRPGDTCATLNDNSGDNMSENGDCDMMADGFDDQDMERPCFTEPAPYPSVPFLLSEPGKQPEIQIPATMNRYLRGYQRDGVRFLYQHYSQNTGAILGDDMGLGKTVQVLAFIAAILGKTGTKADVFCKFIDGDTKGKQPAHRNGAFLIVSPGSVMYNWKDELETWGHFKTGLFHATTKAATLERAVKGRLDVVLTTYETLRNHLNDLNRIKWLAVIMDEVHRLKDPKAQTTVAAKALVVKRRYGLTGTPLQNSLEEFWCVLDWSNPGCLGTAKSFERTVGKPIRKGQSHVVTKRELALGRKRSKELQNKLEKWFLRRTKDLLKDQLPKKDEMVMFCPLMPFQEDVYQTLLQHPDVELVRKKNFPCDCGSGEDRGRCCHRLSSEYEDIKTTTMRFFNLLLKVANHAALLAPSVKQTADQQEKAKDLCDKVFARYPEFTGVAEMSSFELLSDPKYCGKMKVLDKLVRVFQEEHCKLLLFSRSTQLLNILEEYVISRGLVYSRLDGSTKPADRTRLVQEFNHDPGIFVCLVSTKAGSLGLNFTGANVVIIFDPTWNPSNDLQAQDRAYRIGQRRDVRVYRLISSGTIEEMMYLRQVYKQQLANIAVGGTNERRYFTGVEGEKDRKGELFGIENLFSYRAEGASLSKDIVKRTEKLEAGYRVAKYEIVPEKKKSEEEDDLENKVPEGSTKLTTEEDPYNLYEIASQFIDDEEIEAGASGSQETQSYKVDDLTDESVESISQVNGSEGQQTAKKVEGDQSKRLEKIDEVGVDDEFFDALDEEGVFSSDQDMDLSMRPSEISRGSNKFKMKMKKRVSFELFSSPEDEEEEEEEAGGRVRNTRGTNFTRIRKRRKQEQRSVDKSVDGESCDVIPPTASLKSLHREGKTRRNKEPSAGRKEHQTSSSSICDSSSELSESSESLPVNSGVKRSSRLSRKTKNSNVSIKKKMPSVGGGESRLRRVLGRSALDTIVANGKFVTAETSKKDDTLQGILESCGVHYTHANRSIVGPSEAENHMSKQALQDVFELRQFSQQPANCFAALETSDESDDLGVSTQPEKLEKPDITQHARQREAGSSHDQPPSGTCQRSQNAASEAWVEEIGSCTVFIGSTPRGIRRQHFRELSEILGFRSEADLAKHVIESSGEERREILKRYYAGKNPVLASLSSFSGREEKRSRKELERKYEKQGLDETHREKGGNKSKRNLRKRGTKACTVKLEDGNEFQNKALVKHKLQRSGGDVSQSNYRRNEKCLVNKFSKDREEKECTSGEGLIKSADSSTEFVRNKGEDDCRNVDTGARSITAEEAATHSVGCKEEKKRRKRLNKETKEEIEAPRAAVSASSMHRDGGAIIQVKPQGNKCFASVSVLDEFIAPDFTRVNEEKGAIAREECERFETSTDRMRDARIRTEVHERKTSVLDDFI